MTIPPSEPTGAIPNPATPPAPANPTSTPVPTPVATAEPPAKKSRKPVIVTAAVIGALAIGGGTWAIAGKLMSKGEQPEIVIPGDALLYTRIDLDPSAGQKIGAVRFLNKVPQVKDALSGDMREWTFNQIKKQASCLSNQTYSADINTWLGDRAAIALRPGTTSAGPNVVVAVAITDESTARSWLDKTLAACNGNANGADITYTKGYALITDKGKGQATLDALAKGSLATNPTFTGDMSALGETGVWSFWMDTPALVKDMSSVDAFPPATRDQLAQAGRVSAAMRFNPDFIELAGITRGAALRLESDPGGSNLTALPDDTAAVLHIAGLGQLITDNWSTIADAFAKEGVRVSDIETQLGVTLPDDLALLLGKQLSIALPGQTLGAGVPTVGLKVTTTDGPKAKALLDRLVQMAGGSSMLAISVEGNDLFVASTSDYVDRLKAKGTLGTKDSFTLAVANPTTATYAVYVDLDAFESQYIGSVEPDLTELVKALRAVGLSTSTAADGQTSFAIRVVGN